MPKKLKKTLNKKTKLKNTVNVKINIDNSKKSSTRRASTKAPAQQPFVNFPSFQPTRIQQLEPKQQFNNADLTKTMDEYQKQFKTYLETKDKDVKKMIEEFDDTLKKNIAPSKKDESKPGASNVYADNEGEVIFEQPIKKESPKSFTNPYDLNPNTMTQRETPKMPANQLIQEARPVTDEELYEMEQEKLKKEKKSIVNKQSYERNKEQQTVLINEINLIKENITKLLNDKEKTKSENKKKKYENEIEQQNILLNTKKDELDKITKYKKKELTV